MVWICRSGLLISSSTCPAPTFSPDSAAFRSTRADACAVIQRICSGTRVPGPRTSRITSPRATESMRIATRCTVGAAGSSRESAIVARITAAAPAPMAMLRPVFFCGARAISIEVSQP